MWRVSPRERHTGRSVGVQIMVVGELGLLVVLQFRKSQNIPDGFQKYFSLFISLEEVRTLGFAPA